MLRRPGSGRPIECQVLRPITPARRASVRLKCGRSSGRCTSRPPSRPMPPSRATAATRLTGGRGHARIVAARDRRGDNATAAPRSRPGHLTDRPDSRLARHARRARRLARELRRAPHPAATLDGAELGHARRHRRQAALHGRRPRRAAAHRHAAGLSALRARTAGDDVRGAAVDDPPVRRLLDRRGVERLLPQGARRRAARASAWPSTWRPTAATTATIRASSATSARPAWRSTRSRT